MCAGEPDERQRAFLTRLSEFRTHIDRNQHQIPNYGERHRCGEAISSATAEATVNHVISRRMVNDFARWYPGSDQMLSLAA